MDIRPVGESLERWRTILSLNPGSNRIWVIVYIPNLLNNDLANFTYTTALQNRCMSPDLTNGIIMHTTLYTPFID